MLSLLYRPPLEDELCRLLEAQAPDERVPRRRAGAAHGHVRGHGGQQQQERPHPHPGWSHGVRKATGGGKRGTTAI